MGKKNLLLLVMLTANAINVIGQSEFLGLPVSSYIDNVADSEAIKLGLLAKPLGEAADEDRFWTTRKITTTYSFLRVESTPRIYTEDSHAFVPELYLESANGFSLNIGGFFAHSSARDKFFGYGVSSIESERNAYGISIQPAYDALKFWNQEKRPEFMKHSKLIAGLGLAYIHDDAEIRDPFFGTIRYKADAFSFNPNLVFVQPICEKFVTLLIPAYSMEWRHGELDASSQTFDTNFGLFTLTARGDYKVAERFFISAFATWKRDITSRPANSPFDSGEFGGQLRFAICERMALRVGYSYEPFFPYFDTHHCFARFETNF